MNGLSLGSECLLKANGSDTGQQIYDVSLQELIDIVDLLIGLSLDNALGIPVEGIQIR